MADMKRPGRIGGQAHDNAVLRALERGKFRDPNFFLLLQKFGGQFGEQDVAPLMRILSLLDPFL